MNNTSNLPNDLVSILELSKVLSESKKDTKRSRKNRVYYYIKRYKLDHYVDGNTILVSESYFINWYNNFIINGMKDPRECILKLLSLRPMSILEVAADIGISPAKTRYNIYRLIKDGLLEETKCHNDKNKGRNVILYKKCDSGNSVSTIIGNGETFSIATYPDGMQIVLDRSLTGKGNISFTKEQLAAILATTVTHLKQADISISEFISDNINVDKIKIC